MRAQAVQMPSLAGLRLHEPAPTAGSNQAESGPSGTPPPPEVQAHLAALQSAAEKAAEAKRLAAEAKAEAAREKAALAKAAKEAKSAATKAAAAAAQEQLDKEQEFKDDLLWQAYKAKQQQIREEALGRVKAVMEKLAWPRNNGRELPKKDRERLLRELFAAQEKIDKSAQTWGQLSKNRKKYREQLALIDAAMRWREETRPVAKRLGEVLRARRKAVNKYKKDMEAHRKRRKALAVERQSRDRAATVAAARAATDAAARERVALLAAQAAAANVDDAEEVKDAKCREALHDLHEMRAELKAMAQKFGQAMMDVEHHCDAVDPEKGKIDQWMYDILQELDRLQQWIEMKEYEDPGPDGWDVEGHLEYGGEDLADSDSESGEATPRSNVGDGGTWYDRGATKGDGNLFDDIDATFDEDEEIDDEDDDLDEFQMNVVLTTRDPIPDNNSPLAQERAEKFLNAFLYILKTNKTTSAMADWVPANLAAYQLGPTTVLLSLMLTYDLVEQGRNMADDEETPYNVLQGYLEGITPEQWHEATGVHVVNIEGTGIPAVNEEEDEWLQKNVGPDWDKMSNKGLLLNVILQAQDAIARRDAYNDPKKELQRFNPTELEKLFVVEQYKETLNLPKDWFTDPETAKKLDDEMKLAMLQVARESLNEAKDKDDEKGDDVDVDDDADEE